MTDAEILAQYEEFLDGQSGLSDTLKIQLANNTKNKLETELQLEILKEIDTSHITVIGRTYLTPYSVPTDWFEPIPEIWIGTDPFPLTQVRLEKRERFKDSSRHFYIKPRTKQLFLCGTQTQAQTITIPYLIVTPDITSASVDAGTTTLTWPRFHSLLSMQMAIDYYAIDAGDKSRSWDDRWTAMYTELKNSLIVRDQKLKLAFINNAAPYGSERPNFSENKINDLP